MKLSLSILLSESTTATVIAEIVSTLEQIPGVDRVSLVTDSAVARPGLSSAKPREVAPDRQRATGTMGAQLSEIPSTVQANTNGQHGSKSDFIRQHPKASPSEVQALAAKAGMTITPNVVAALRWRDAQKKSAKKGGRK